MLNTHLVQLLKTLDSREREELKLFVQSPFFNRGKFRNNMARLLGLLFEFMETEGDFEKSEIYSRLFPGEHETPGRMEKNMVELAALVRSFLLTNQYWNPENDFYQQLDWAVLLRKRSMISRYHQTISHIRKLQSTAPFESSEFYLKQFLLESEVHFWESVINRSKGDQNLPPLLNLLGHFYHLNRMELLNRLLVQQKVTQLDDSTADALALVDGPVPAALLEDNIALKINLQINQMLNAPVPDKADFYALAELLKRHENQIEPEALQEFYAFLRNTCTLLLNYGNAEMLPVFFQLQKDNLEKGYFYLEGKISPGAFGNIVTAATRVGEYDWALNFMEAHKDRIIGGDETDDFYRLTMASYFFAIKDFDKALDWIPTAPQDTMYLFRARRLRLKVYYETKSDLLFYELDAFKMALSRASQKLISPQFRELQANFVNFLYQIAKSPPGDKARRQKLSQRIIAKPSVYEKDWLLEKLK